MLDIDNILQSRYTLEFRPTDRGVLHAYWSEMESGGQLVSALGGYGENPAPVHFDAFIRRVEDPFTMFILYSDALGPVGHHFLENFTGESCVGHFNILRRSHGKAALKLGRAALRLLFSSTKGSSSVPYIQTMMGLTPIHNRLACRFIEKIGMVPKTIIPNSCYHEGQPSDCLLTVITRDEVLNGTSR